jgi:hypothetical protein
MGQYVWFKLTIEGLILVQQNATTGGLCSPDAPQRSFSQRENHSPAQSNRSYIGKHSFHNSANHFHTHENILLSMKIILLLNLTVLTQVKIIFMVVLTVFTPVRIIFTLNKTFC